MKTLRWLRVAIVTAVLAALFVPAANGEVEAKVVTLWCKSDKAMLLPESNKVFIVEHIVFNDAWKNSAEPMQLYLRPDASSGGSYFRSTLTYSVAFNTLTRPLRIPYRSGLAVNVSANTTAYKVYIFGLLVDQEDLYAAIVSDIEEFGLASLSTLSGTLRLASPQPSILTVESSTALQQWVAERNARVRRTADTAQRAFDIAIDPQDKSKFYRLKTRARREVPTATRRRIRFTPEQGASP